MSFTYIPVQNEPNKSPLRKRLLVLLWEISHLSSPSRSSLGRLIFIRGPWGHSVGKAPPQECSVISFSKSHLIIDWNHWGPLVFLVFPVFVSFSPRLGEVEIERWISDTNLISFSLAEYPAKIKRQIRTNSNCSNYNDRGHASHQHSLYHRQTLLRTSHLFSFHISSQ